MKSLIAFFAVLPLFGMSQHQYCGEPIDISLSHNIESGVVYNWSVSTGYVTDENQWVIEGIGDFVVTLTASLNGCETIDKKLIVVDSCTEWTFYAPNAFVPDGVNNKWRPDGFNIDIKTIFIFNRWGLIVWEGQGYWNGFDLDQNICDGVYVWQCYFDTPDGHMYRTGSVTVVR